MTTRDQVFVVATVGMLTLSSGVSPAALASEPQSDQLPPLQKSVPGSEMTIEMVCEQAVRNIAMRYNLNEEQTAETQKLMKREVNKFFRDHEDAIWPLIRSMFTAQLGRKPPEDLEELKRIGRGARPLAQLAKEAIFAANEEWRRILTADQKKMHDFDLAEMEKTFEQIDRNFEAWAEGEPRENPLFPGPEAAARGPAPPPRPPRGLPEPEIETFKVTIFDTFVEEFITDYELDEAQIGSARSILKEFKAEANDLKAAKKAEFAKIAAEQKQALGERDQKKIKQLETQRKKLLEPVYELFAKMEQRLKGLLNSRQLERYAARHTTADPVAESVTPAIETNKTAPTKSAAVKSKPEKSSAEAKEDRG